MAFRLVRGVLPGRFLTARHGVLTRLSLGALAGLATLAVTFEPRLAQAMLADLRADRFLTGLRRLSWYMRRGWPGLDVSRDPVFVFPQGLEPAAIAAQRRFLARRARRMVEADLLAERSYLSACEMLALPAPSAPAAARFEAEAGACLAHILAAPGGGAGRLVAADAPARAEFSRPAAEAALRDTMALLARHGIPAFMLSGTFLGAVREGGILAHDYDIDLGVMADTVDPARLRAVLAGAGPFHLLASEAQVLFERDAGGTLRRRVVPVLHKLRHPSGVVADIFLHYREGGTIWHGSAEYRWDNSDFALRDWPIAGIGVPGPADADRYLTENYGDWRIPRVDFHCAVDTTNQRLLPSPLSLVLALRRLWLAGRSRPEAVAPLLRQMRAAGHIRPDPAAPGGWSVAPGLFAP